MNPDATPGIVLTKSSKTAGRLEPSQSPDRTWVPISSQKYTEPRPMPSDSPKADSSEGVRAADAMLNTSDQALISTADPASEDPKGTCHLPTGSAQPADPAAGRIADGNKDAAMLRELQDSLHTIGSGVEELATTVQDLLGLSDSDYAPSEDYDYDSDGQGKPSWIRIKTNARARRRLRHARKNLLGGGQAAGAVDDSDSGGEGSKKRRDVLPRIRECNFEQFQSRPFGGSDRVFCIDVLIAGDELEKDIREFGEVVDKIKSGRIQSWDPARDSDRKGEATSEEAGNKWVRRIRINSRAVLEILRHLRRGSRRFGSRPIVFERPFQLLISLQKEMLERLSDMKRFASAASGDETILADPDKPVDVNMSQDRDWINLGRKLCESQGALDELACFVDFMESRIMPDSRRYRGPSSSLPKTIRYEDLWYLYKPGDLVFVTRDISRRDQFRSTPFSQQIVRVIQTRLTPRSLPKDIPSGRRLGQGWSLICHFIEYNGAAYVPTHQIFPHILPFSGERKVTELPAYPISYLEDDQIIAQAISDGATYVSLIDRRSGFYSGWTRTITPHGTKVSDDTPDGHFKGPEHIESEILVDFQETFNAFPQWKPRQYQVMAADDGIVREPFGTTESELPILEWDYGARTTHDYFDRLLSADPTEWNEMKKFLKEDVSGQFREHTRTAPTGVLRALLPRRIFAYAVLERRFAPLDIRFVRSADVEANDKAFEKLEIDRNYKRLILSLVKSHFDKIEKERTLNVEIETQDLIRGKGKGVVILLHGVPGVGKTATAEAVALKWKKPLFPITCGDLGYTAETLEKSLNEIFRLAHHWGCILLLDEADVFITQRERHDLKRNALVSAFLRVLEYYNGIMFLTTNRAGVLDEAIKSRVHLSLYYDHLTEQQTVAIFKQHIQRLRDIERQRNPDQNDQIMVLHREIIQFAKDHFNQRDNNHAPGSNFGRWNGRQIRNAFLIASSLAHYDSEDGVEDEEKDDLAEPGRKKQKQLGRSQFELVAQTTLMYDQFRASVHSGKSDDHVAFDREERAMSSQPRPSTPVRMNNPGTSFG